MTVSTGLTSSAFVSPTDERITQPFAVIDIGSNSVRLVVFAALSRAPITMFNEKVLCGLGRNDESPDALSTQAMERALATLGRFAKLLDAMRVDDVVVVATAAVRDAANGEEFCDRIRMTTGLKVQVIPGKEEARLSALGVIAGTPEASGVMGDLGGGSLELVALDKGEIGQGITLQLGTLRIGSLLSGSNLTDAQNRIDEALAQVDWLDSLSGADLHTVGGAWRALGRLQMARDSHPLQILHGYDLAMKPFDELCRVVAQQHAGSMKLAQSVASERRESLPAAALVMSRLLRRTKIGRVVFSAFGLREGLVFDRLSERERNEDPLIVACRGIAVRTARFPVHGEALLGWLDPVFVGEIEERRRLRFAACLLSDIAWRVHPDYRAEHAVEVVLSAPLVGLTHSERLLLALAIGLRFGRERTNARLRDLATHLPVLDQDWARRVGLCLGLAHTLSGGTVDVLRQSRLALDGQTLRLDLDEAASGLAGEAVEKRLKRLARTMGLAPMTAAASLL